MQINDENLHLVRCLLDEVFGRENFVAVIAFRKTSYETTTLIPTIFDYLLWYGKNRPNLKYRRLYNAAIAKDFEFLEYEDGTYIRLTKSQREHASTLLNTGELFRSYDLASPGVSASTSVSYEFQGRVFRPSVGRHWKTTIEGLNRLAIAERLGIWEVKGGVKIAGRGFAVFKGVGSQLERALADFMVDLYTRQHDYMELSPPLLADYDSLICTGHFPRWEQGVYSCKDDGLFLIPSAEVPLTNLYRDQILDAQLLPLSYVACTPCFRRPEASWGRENRQAVRLHQFRKIELVKFVSPESSSAQLDQIVSDVEEALQLLELPYRVVLDCVGQLSFASAKSYGVEVWMAASGSYLRVCSCRNYADFQTRRGNIRFRSQREACPGFIHTVGASGPAVPRLMAAIIENCQSASGKVLVPKVLQRYMDGTVRMG